MANEAALLISQACAIGLEIESKLSAIMKDRRLVEGASSSLSTMRKLYTSAQRSNPHAVARGLKATILVAKSLHHKNPHRSKKIAALQSELQEVARQVGAIVQAVSVNGHVPAAASNDRLSSSVQSPSAQTTSNQTSQFQTPVTRRELRQSTPGGTQLLSELRRTIHLADELLRPDKSACPSPEISPEPALNPSSEAIPGYTSVQQSRMEVQEMIRLASKLNDLVRHHVRPSLTQLRTHATPEASTTQLDGSHNSTRNFTAAVSRSLRFGQDHSTQPKAPGGEAYVSRMPSPVISVKLPNKRKAKQRAPEPSYRAKRQYQTIWKGALDDCLATTRKVVRANGQKNSPHRFAARPNATARASSAKEKTQAAVMQVREAFTTAYFTEQAHQLQAARISAALQRASDESVRALSSIRAPIGHHSVRFSATAPPKFMRAVKNSLQTQADASQSPFRPTAGTSAGRRNVGGWLEVETSAAKHTDAPRFMHVGSSRTQSSSTWSDDTHVDSRSRWGHNADAPNQHKAAQRPKQQDNTRPNTHLLKPKRRLSQQDIVDYATQMALMAAQGSAGTVPSQARTAGIKYTG